MGRSDQANLEAMGLADACFFPHYGVEWEGLLAEKAGGGELGEAGRVICLTDDGEQTFTCGDDE